MTPAAALALAAVLACSTDDSPTPAGGSAPPASEEAVRSDAELLGRELAELLDQAASYRSSHRDQLPRSVAQMGVDSLTPELVRRVRARSDSAVAQVGFRRAAGHALVWCEASEAALEEASLNAGAFRVWCRRADGGADSLTVGGTR